MGSYCLNDSNHKNIGSWLQIQSSVQVNNCQLPELLILALNVDNEALDVTTEAEGLLSILHSCACSSIWLWLLCFVLSLLVGILDNSSKSLVLLKRNLLILLHTICTSVSCDIHNELLITLCLKESCCSSHLEGVVCFVAIHTSLRTQFLHSRG